MNNMLNVQKIHQDFPILNRQMNGFPLVYLDNGATSQKPKQAIEAVADYYFNHNANVNRGAHTLGVEATEMYEKARQSVTNFIKAKSPKEIIFVRNSTEAINLVAYTWGKANIIKGDEILITEMEHHSNLVPWQILAKEKVAVLKYLPFNAKGLLEIDKLTNFVSSKTKILSLVHISNALGTINPVKKIIQKAKSINPNIVVLADASQSVPHLPVSVADLDCDFLAFTGHKMLGPMGIGILYGKEQILETMPPFLYGGDMIKEVYLDHSTWNDLPEKFEAGTPNVAGAVGLEAAINYLNNIGLDNIREHEKELTKYTLSELTKISKVTIYGPLNVEHRGGIVTFNIEGVHPHDVSEVLDKMGIAVRVGHHCAMPLHQKLGVPASVRASFYIYNTKEEVEKLVRGVEEVIKTFKI